MEQLSQSAVKKPIRPERIIQFGEGNFLRGFVDWIIQEMDDKTDFNSSVVILPGRVGSKSIEKYKDQDYLYYVNLQGKLDGETIDSLTLIDVISRGVDPKTDFDAFLALADVPEMRFIISNTTEAGITFDDKCRFDDRPAVSFPGRLTQLLYRRFKTFKGDPAKGFIILPCELIFDNGRKLQECVSKYIDLWEPDFKGNYEAFKSWVNNYCYFCSTLVDRIVTGQPSSDISKIHERIGFKDNLVVQGEAFHLWVIERPENMSKEELRKEFPAEKAGLNVLITDSEAPYHERKVALLNGPHTILSPVAFLNGIDIVRDACNHPLVSRYIRKVQMEELLPTLNLPEDELKEYAESVLERFNNPFIDHRLESIMLNAFPKFATRDLPALIKYQKIKGNLPEGLVLGLAALIKYYKGGKRKDGKDIIPNDAPEIISLLTDLWSSGDYDKIAQGVLASEILWGANNNLNAIPGLTTRLSDYLARIEACGMEPVLQELMDQNG